MAKKKAFGAEIDTGIADTFTEIVTQRGFAKYRAVETALRVFMALPLEIQARMVNEGVMDDQILQLLSDCLVDSEIQAFLSTLPAERRFRMMQAALAEEDEPSLSKKKRKKS